MMHPTVCLLGLTCAASALAPLPVLAQTNQYRSSTERRLPPPNTVSPALEKYRERLIPGMLQDFGEKYIFAPANAALPPPGKGEKRVVFMGDSITDFWELTKFFPGKPYVNRGIGGQITPQMLLRFHADVIALKPSAVVILAGINDLGKVLQVQSEQEITANYEAMAEMAVAHGIVPIFTKVMPIYRPGPPTEDSATDRKNRINAWLERFCKGKGFVLIDYAPVLGEPDGQLGRAYSKDGTHPNEAGYARMSPVAARAISQALAQRSKIRAGK